MGVNAWKPGVTGKLGVGATVPGYKLDVRGDTFTQGTAGTVSGTFGTYHSASDVRLKTDITTIPNALEKVLALRGVNFHWKDPAQDTGLHMGLIAQEVEPIVPEAVHTADDAMGTKAVEYEYLVGLLIEGIKAQQAQLDALQAEIESLKAAQ